MRLYERHKNGTDGEDWYVRHHGRLIINPDGTARRRRGVCACVRVCAYACTRACVQVLVYMSYVCIFVLSLCAYVYVCLYACACTCAPVRASVCMHMYVIICACMHVSAHVCGMYCVTYNTDNTTCIIGLQFDYTTDNGVYTRM